MATVDLPLSISFGRSGSATTYVIASTRGSRPLESDVAPWLGRCSVRGNLSTLPAEQVGIVGSFHGVDCGDHADGTGPCSG